MRAFGANLVGADKGREVVAGRINIEGAAAAAGTSAAGADAHK